MDAGYRHAKTVRSPGREWRKSGTWLHSGPNCLHVRRRQDHRRPTHRSRWELAGVLHCPLPVRDLSGSDDLRPDGQFLRRPVRRRTDRQRRDRRRARHHAGIRHAGVSDSGQPQHALFCFWLRCLRQRPDCIGHTRPHRRSAVRSCRRIHGVGKLREDRHGLSRQCQDVRRRAGRIHRTHTGHGPAMAARRQPDRAEGRHHTRLSQRRHTGILDRISVGQRLWRHRAHRLGLRGSAAGHGDAVRLLHLRGNALRRLRRDQWRVRLELR